ncbi:alkaline phosphatase family protein [Rhodoferax sp.]|uniref:phospholipase C n=1 Tax=Rhodoferax sp. TaxID=50421 RepID=UPI002843906A|nr:alkaline phosphatase family protein [Rhodoferax sp.]MDR3371537.1 alkaline phosphatase family protein [Rhodoferax sp.]
MFQKTALAAAAASALLALTLQGCGGSSDSVSTPTTTAVADAAAALATTSPIKHIVVIFGENVSFDHYFATYPVATNPSGETAFTAKANTPTVNGLSGALLTNNPNFTNTANGTGAANPFRLDPSQAATADMGHNYKPEQQAFDDGLMDLFPLYTGVAGSGGSGAFNTKGLVMGYYDGNTVTALWNYAQNYAMSDNSFSTTFGPSTPGAINLISGQTGGVVYDGTTLAASDVNHATPDGQGGYTMIGDVDPTGDVCSSTTNYAHMKGKNVGDYLNAAGISWGFFEGGFDLTLTNANGTTGCARSSVSSIVGGTGYVDYIPHHQPFQYYASTANPTHKRPSSVAAIGTANDGGANHQYDSHDFFDALAAGNMPAVSYLKAPAIQDGHAGYSDPTDEQQFLTKSINTIMQSPFWKDTLIVVAYDDSDGWYDHVMGPIVNSGFNSPADVLKVCKDQTKTVMAGPDGYPVAGRCGYGTRQPLLLISPYAKANFVDHSVTDQTSILKFIEDNWLSGQRIAAGTFDNIAGGLNSMLNFATGGSTPAVILDASTGAVK